MASRRGIQQQTTTISKEVENIEERLPKEIVLRALKQVQKDCEKIDQWENCRECEFYCWNQGCMFTQDKYDGHPIDWAVDEYGVRTYEQAQIFNSSKRLGGALK